MLISFAVVSAWLLSVYLLLFNSFTDRKIWLFVCCTHSICYDMTKPMDDYD